MINLKISKNQKFNEFGLVEILFYTFPLSFIIGNLAVSINTLLFIVLSLFLIRKKQLAFRFDISFWLLFVFFLYLFLATTIQALSNETLISQLKTHKINETDLIFKSFLLARFLLLIFVIDTLFFNKILNLKKLFLSSLLCTSFVCFDVILQYIIGFDIFGLKSSVHWNSGPFGDEIIAGAYLVNFSFFSIFYVLENFKNKKLYNLLSIFIIVLHLSATLVAGNRMPMILFLFGCFLVILFMKNLRFVMTLSLLIFLSIFSLLMKNDIYLKRNYSNFLININVINYINIQEAMKKNYSTPIEQYYKKRGEFFEDTAEYTPVDIILLRNSGHNRIFRTSIALWKEEPFFGYGLKSFRTMCWKLLQGTSVKYKVRGKVNKKLACSNHSHNYYFQLLSETGLIGTILLVFLFFILLKNSFGYLKKNRLQKNSEINLMMPVIIVFILEIWPIRSAGNFFTNWGATFFWLNTAMLIAANRQNFVFGNKGKTKI